MRQKELSIGEFYDTIRNQFPEINKMETWKENNWETEPWTNSSIMTEIAREMSTWLDNNEIKKVQSFLDYIELSNMTGETTLTAYIYTDFLVTISELKKTTREKIKSMLGPESKKLYTKLLDYYRELDQ